MNAQESSSCKINISNNYANSEKAAKAKSLHLYSNLRVLCNFSSLGIGCGNLKICSGTETKRKTKPKPPATKEMIIREVAATVVIS